MSLTLSNNERIIHSLKTAFACLIGIAITKSVHLPVDQWLVITIIVVMSAQVNVGGMMQKSYMRFLGTLIGLIIAVITLGIFGNHIATSTIAIVFATFLFSYISVSQKSYSEAGPLGAATVVIILLNTQPTLENALGRFFEITAGIIIAALVSQFIIPINARAHLRRTQAHTLLKLKECYKNGITANSQNITKLDEEIIQSLIKQRQLAKESKREQLGITFNLEHFQNLLQCEKEILRSIALMHEALMISPKLFPYLMTQPQFHELNAMVMKSLAEMANSLKAKKSIHSSIHFEMLYQLEAKVRAEKITFSDEMLITLDGFFFCANYLIKKLSILSNLILEKFPNA